MPDTLNITLLTSWQLVELMIEYLDNDDIENAKHVQDEILKRTYQV